MLFTILVNHITYIKKDKYKTSLILDIEDKEDVFQNTMIKILEECRKANGVQPIKGKLFIQWVFIQLRFKYGDQLKKIKSQNDKNQEKISQQGYDKDAKPIDEVINWREETKEIEDNEDIEERDLVEVFNDDLKEVEMGDYSQIEYLEKKELRKIIFEAITNLNDNCKKIFKILLRKRKTKYVHKYFKKKHEFKDATENQINMMIRHCRQNLKILIQAGGYHE